MKFETSYVDTNLPECSECEGNGFLDKPGKDLETCTTCGGLGHIKPKDKA